MKDTNTQFTKEERKMTNKHFVVSTSVIIKDMKVKQQYHDIFTPFDIKKSIILSDIEGG